MSICVFIACATRKMHSPQREEGDFEEKSLILLRFALRQRYARQSIVEEYG